MKILTQLSMYIGATLSCALLSGGLTAVAVKHGLGSSEMASWVQAVGATLGLGIAIWVPYKQKQDAVVAAEHQREDNERRVCLAFRDELALLSQYFANDGVTELLRDAPDEIFDYEIPVPRERFPIYAAMMARITEIESEEIRRSIIDAYEAVHRLIDLCTINNRRLIEFSALLHAQRPEDSSRSIASEAIDRRRLLVGLRKAMREVCEIGVQRVNKALALLDAKLGAGR